MPRHVSVVVRGLSCVFQGGVLDAELTAKTNIKVKIMGGKYNGRFKDETSYDPIYFKGENGTISCGIGALLFLAKNNPFVSIDFDSIEPERRILGHIEIPQGVIKSPKWLVNGKERWYFHEALEICRKHHCGTIKLPTGSGKTVIELTLAYNNLREIGTGIILVPSITIKDQFIKSAREFGIKLMDYREWLSNPVQEKQILISLPTVVYNDIIDIRESKDGWKLESDKHCSITWIIGDEVHHAGAKTWNTIFLGLSNLTRSYGFSALPVESSYQTAISFGGIPYEDAMTISVVGPVIYQRSTRELKDFLNIPTLINLSYNWPKNMWSAQQTNDWRQIIEMTYKNKQRMKLIADVIRILIDRGYSTIAHVGERSFGVELLNLVGSQKCVAWYGKKKVIGFSGSVADLRAQIGFGILGIIGTSHLIEGLDLDSPLNALVLTEGKKTRQVIQKCGRITRPSEKPSVIINLADSGLWILPRQSELRKETIQSEFDSDVYKVSSLSQLVSKLDMIEKKNFEQAAN